MSFLLLMALPTFGWSGMLDDSNPRRPIIGIRTSPSAKACSGPIAGNPPASGIVRRIPPTESTIGPARSPRAQCLHETIGWVAMATTPENGYKGYWGLASPNSIVFRKLTQMLTPGRQ